MPTTRPRSKRRGVAERQPPRYHGPPRLLLDTHAWLWWTSGNPRLGARARVAIRHAMGVQVSVVCAWEVVIKVARGQLRVPGMDDFATELARDAFSPLPVELRHVQALTALPALHRDPFDRMLAAQALADDLTVVTADPVFSRYGVTVLAAGA